MMEPQRLLYDPTSPVASALLRAALDEPTPVGASARALAALGIGTAGVAIASSAAAAGSVSAGKSVSLGVIKWLGAGVVAGVFVAAAVAPSRPESVTTAHGPEPMTAPPVAGEPRGKLAPVDPATDTESPVDDPQPDPSPPEPSAPREPASLGSAPRATLTPSATPSEPPADALSAEIALLDAARGALARGEVATALALLDRHDSEHPAGRLRPEAFVLRLEALVRGGRVETARALARRWLENHPNAAHAARIRKIVGQ